MKSPLGGSLNELIDVISDAVLYAPFAFVAGLSSGLVVIAVFFALLTEMAGVVTVHIGASRCYDGPMGKSDRAFVFGLLGPALGFGFDDARWLNVVLVVVIVLSAITVVNRSRKALEELRERDIKD